MTHLLFLEQSFFGDFDVFRFITSFIDLVLLGKCDLFLLLLIIGFLTMFVGIFILLEDLPIEQFATLAVLRDDFIDHFDGLANDPLGVGVFNLHDGNDEPLGLSLFEIDELLDSDD